MQTNLSGYTLHYLVSNNTIYLSYDDIWDIGGGKYGKLAIYNTYPTIQHNELINPIYYRIIIFNKAHEVFGYRICTDKKVFPLISLESCDRLLDNLNSYTKKSILSILKNGYVDYPICLITNVGAIQMWHQKEKYFFSTQDIHKIYPQYPTVDEKHSIGDIFATMLGLQIQYPHLTQIYQNLLDTVFETLHSLV